MFNSKHFKQLSDRGISLEQANKQLEIFKKGIAPVVLVAPAIPNDGIEVYDDKQIRHYVNLFQKEKNRYSILKFVPASGAASRMFKALFEGLAELESKASVGEVLEKQSQLADFFKELEKYPFFEDLVMVCESSDSHPAKMIGSHKHAELLQLFLKGDGLGYGELPKGLLKFHRYKAETRTAFEEHFEEASMFLRDKNNSVKLHFTVSPEHMKLFSELAEKLKRKYADMKNVSFEVEFSVQKPSTDTLAVDLDNKPFLMDEGQLHFRPGGHGALLDNMQDINEKIVFVSNIDNVAPDKTKALRVKYKELLSGILIERLEIIHGFLKSLEKSCNEKLKNEIIDFVKSFVSKASAEELKKLETNDFVTEAVKILNRPIRVCGMVKNVGEPGGGPFWIKNKKGEISKQVVESSQVDLSDPKQEKIFLNATHFNPVDMVCYTYDYKDRKFNLKDFRDPDMAFIASKSQGGKSLKALELPGLWNGSMAGWLSFFVDVPIETFSPVKTIFDLLREEHL
ncbi:MAG: DUF4301 family protein [Bacteroidales bacterium]|nr:DUF4301 family protein [Bacteroidales bacterium]MCB8998965.1 DUF4301 family protein [Bacteroidales bacterium]MCB9013748.1 DUF4301 family protein [Bacteroidales bacterium]